MRAVSKKLLQSEDCSSGEVVTSQEANKLAEEMQLEMQLQLKVLQEQVLQQQQLLVAAGNLSLVNILATDPVFSPSPPWLQNPESFFLPQFMMCAGSQLA